MHILEICLVFVLLGLLQFLKAAEYCKDIGPISSRDMTVGPFDLRGVFPSGIYADKYCGAGLRDLSATHIVELHAGESYMIEWGSKTCINGNASKGRIWIDWKALGWAAGVHHYDEDLVTGFSSHYGDFEAVTNFTVPHDAALGITRMRVMVVEYYDPSKFNPIDVHPCNKFIHGGTTDFGVNITVAGKYCYDTGPSSDLDTALGSITIAGADGSGFTSDRYCGEGLRDLTKTHTVKLVIGQSYTIHWGSNSCGNQFPSAGQVWIDWKSIGWQTSGHYDDDIIATSSGEEKNWETTSQFTVPADAVVGTTIMRAMVVEALNPLNLKPCYGFAFGGTTDFGVEIVKG